VNLSESIKHLQGRSQEEILNNLTKYQKQIINLLKENNMEIKFSNRCFVDKISIYLSLTNYNIGVYIANYKTGGKYFAIYKEPDNINKTIKLITHNLSNEKQFIDKLNNIKENYRKKTVNEGIKHLKPRTKEELEKLESKIPKYVK